MDQHQGPAPTRTPFDMSTTQTLQVRAQQAGAQATPVDRQDGSLHRALLQGLETPIAALRASMESLSQALREDSAEARSARVDWALREVELIGRNVRGLCDFASPPVPRPLACSLEEIVSAARQRLTPEQRERVLMARCAARMAVRVDGPLLAECLLRLIENALEASEGLVLIVARTEGTCVSFSVIDDSARALAPGWEPIPFRTTKPNRLGLGLALTQRDVALLGGSLEFAPLPDGGTCARVTVMAREEE